MSYVTALLVATPAFVGAAVLARLIHRRVQKNEHARQLIILFCVLVAVAVLSMMVALSRWPR